MMNIREKCMENVNSRRSLLDIILENKRIFVFACMLITILSRTVFLDKYPMGLSQDEAFSAYDAWSLANYGTDCFGYHFPVYNTTWGSGMSVLYSWMAIPFIKILGLNLWSVRLPEVIMGVISVYVLYKLMEEVANEQIALITLFLFAINPWHIVLSRWGLDSAPTPAFVLIGMYFFIKGLEKEKYLLLSALFYGLSLYCYAFIWTLLPIMLLLQVIYGIMYKKLRISKFTVCSVLILGIMALPLVLFLAVNFGFIEPINTNFISIPKMYYFRSGELSSGGFLAKLYMYYCVLFLQNDNNIWNQVPGFGLHYEFALVFAGVGLICVLWDTFNNFRKKVYSPYIFMLIQFVVLSFAAVIIDKCDTNKLNLLHIPMITFTAIGIYRLTRVISEKFLYVVVGVYIVAFACFEYVYFTDYQEAVSEEFNAGVIEATEYAMTLTEDTICVTDKIYHSQLMYASKIPTPEYVDSVVYSNYSEIWLEAESFGQFKFMKKDIPPDTTLADVYIWQIEDADIFKDAGFMVEEFDNFIVAFK